MEQEMSTLAWIIMKSVAQIGLFRKNKFHKKTLKTLNKDVSEYSTCLVVIQVFLFSESP